MKTETVAVEDRAVDQAVARHVLLHLLDHGSTESVMAAWSGASSVRQ
jgi:hypothetical protein